MMDFSNFSSLKILSKIKAKVGLFVLCRIKGCLSNPNKSCHVYLIWVWFIIEPKMWIPRGTSLVPPDRISWREQVAFKVECYCSAPPGDEYKFWPTRTRAVWIADAPGKSLLGNGREHISGYYHWKAWVKKMESCLPRWKLPRNVGPSKLFHLRVARKSDRNVGKI